MIRLSDHRYLLPRDALEVFDGADRRALRTEDGALFDVEFHEGVRCHEPRHFRAEIADTAEFGADRHAA
jgi:hypothetical protein